MATYALASATRYTKIKRAQMRMRKLGRKSSGSALTGAGHRKRRLAKIRPIGRGKHLRKPRTIGRGKKRQISFMTRLSR